MLAPGSVASSEGTAVYRISTFSERDYDGKIPHREDNGAGGTERSILVTGAVHTVICLHSGSELKESDRNFKPISERILARILQQQRCYFTRSTDLLAAARPLDPNRCARRRVCRPETAQPPQNQQRFSCTSEVRSARTNSSPYCE